MSEATPEVRVGDSERRCVDDRLMAAVGDGRLTLAEYDERAAVLWQARTRSELELLTADLPAEATAPLPPAAAPARGRTRRVVAVMSEDRFSGALADGQQVEGWALMGKAVVDLRREDLPDGTRVRVRAVMGEVEVRVPAGTQVQLSGMALMGERKVRVAPGDGPVVHVNAYALMGSVAVTTGKGSVVAARRGQEVPAQPAIDLVKHDAATPARCGAPLARLRRRAAGLAVPLALVGVLASGTDGRALFGSDEVVVTADDADVAVSVLFGSVQVVVQDGVRVDKSGLVVFGSASCEDACAPDRQGEEVSLRALGGFGSVEVLTKAEYDAQRVADEREQLEERDDD